MTGDRSSNFQDQWERVQAPDCRCGHPSCPKCFAYLKNAILKIIKEAIFSQQGKLFRLEINIPMWPEKPKEWVKLRNQIKKRGGKYIRFVGTPSLIIANVPMDGALEVLPPKAFEAAVAKLTVAPLGHNPVWFSDNLLSPEHFTSKTRGPSDDN